MPVAIPLAAGLGLPAPVSHMPAMEVVVEFEKSGRWPADLRAIQKINLAFFERLCSESYRVLELLYLPILLRH